MALIWERHHAGDGDAARALCEFAVEALPDISGYAIALAYLHLSPGGDHQRSADLVEPLLTLGPEQWGHEHSVTFGLALASEVVATLGLERHARMVHDHLLPFRGQIVVLAAGTICFGAADRLLGMMAPLLGAPLEEALAYFDAAEELEDGLGALALVATTAYWRGRTLAAFGGAEHHEAAVAALEDAAADAPPGMVALRRAIETELRSLRRRRVGP